MPPARRQERRPASHIPSQVDLVADTIREMLASLSELLRR